MSATQNHDYSDGAESTGGIAGERPPMQLVMFSLLLQTLLEGLAVRPNFCDMIQIRQNAKDIGKEKIPSFKMEPSRNKRCCRRVRHNVHRPNIQTVSSSGLLNYTNLCPPCHLQKSNDQQRNNVDNLNHRVDRRTCGVFIRIAHGIACYGCSMRARALPAVMSSFNIFLRIIPSAASGESLEIETKIP